MPCVDGNYDQSILWLCHQGTTYSTHSITKWLLVILLTKDEWKGEQTVFTRHMYNNFIYQSPLSSLANAGIG